MELQRILARDTRSAMEQVFSLYGEDAMIVANNKVKDQTEIIVAIDMVPDVKAALTKAPANAEENQDAVKFNDLIEARLQGQPHESELSANDPQTAALEPAFESRIVPSIAPTTKIPAVDPLIQLSINQSASGFNNQDYKEAADREYLKAREIVDLVKQELSAMRDEFKMSQHKDSWTGKLAVNEEMGPLIESLNETGMPLGMRESVIEVINQSASMGDAIAQLTAAIGDEIEHIDLINNLQGVHVIAGSFGAGKTLMAGRLAKQMAQQYGEDQVALISFNDVRIGAWAQTQLIGSQAGVDTFRANSIDVLMQLTAELSDRKLTIIDTSGVDIERHINALNNALPDAQKHLVLASDASEASAKRLLKNDGPKWDSVMLSRFEAEVHPWAVIYLLLQHAVPLSLAAMNPNISDNAIPLNGLTLAEQALSQLPIHLV